MKLLQARYSKSTAVHFSAGSYRPLGGDRPLRKEWTHATNRNKSTNSPSANSWSSLSAPRNSIKRKGSLTSFGTRQQAPGLTAQPRRQQLNETQKQLDQLKLEQQLNRAQRELQLNHIEREQNPFRRQEQIRELQLQQQTQFLQDQSRTKLMQQDLNRLR